jgi:hypothetical protein
LPKEGVLGREGLPLVSDGEDVALVHVKFHLPLDLPLLQVAYGRPGLLEARLNI